MKHSISIGFVVILMLACIATGVISSVLVASRMSTPAVVFPQTAQAYSDRAEGYLTCTGSVDSENEAVFVLDQTTGQLSAAVVSQNGNTPGFQSRYQASVLKDLENAVKEGGSTAAKTGKKRGNRTSRKDKDAAKAVELTMPQEPKFIMTTGKTMFKGFSGKIKPATSALFITEINTGIMLVYVLPWDSTAHAGNQPFTQALQLYFADRFVTPIVMEEALE